MKSILKPQKGYVEENKHVEMEPSSTNLTTSVTVTGLVQMSPVRGSRFSRLSHVILGKLEWDSLGLME